MEQDVKQRILLAAKELFAVQGFDGTTIRQICDKANANISLVSYYFGGKEKVFQHIFETYFPGTKLDQAEAMFRDPFTGLQFLMDQVMSMSFDDFHLSLMIDQELLMHSSRSEIVMSYVQPVWAKLEELLQRGKEQGVFHFESLANTLLIIRGISLSAKIDLKMNTSAPVRSQEEIEQIKQTAIQFIMDGLKVDRARSN
ncbi:TetR family transcriptional regulator [Paenibacillus cellulosilyticus]|uniref:TetR family transcriptional regulator n=1 Tax=Paenibacillus cellulosilyticus TaxID=375489 RepID=A0A2V2YV50_9BACL|nr:TetR/AcrR family transcriptional regulator [Paenibacillus cellulosilyticus]PWW04847.1 TetR family transcriptional regulator [Paenibacillus cellulosilyticus]QKS45959.1 TetR/AcrR family transcriptional regulator [Paenibacillus cellulosilyticus]